MNIHIKNNQIKITGKIFIPFNKAKLIAANPIDRMINYSGSGLPFPNSKIAFENTPNIYNITSSLFSTEFIYPNSYYMPNGTNMIKPTIYLIVDDKIIDYHELPEILPLKKLIYRTSTSLEKYHGYKEGHLPIVDGYEKMVSYKNMKLEHDIS